MECVKEVRAEGVVSTYGEVRGRLVMDFKGTMKDVREYFSISIFLYRGEVSRQPITQTRDKEVFEALFPAYAHLRKWHLTGHADYKGTLSPLWYKENTVFHVKGGFLDRARNTAVWQDATDEDLREEGLEERLAARLPLLMEEFVRDMKAIGIDTTMECVKERFEEEFHNREIPLAEIKVPDTLLTGALGMGRVALKELRGDMKDLTEQLNKLSKEEGELKEFIQRVERQRFERERGNCSELRSGPVTMKEMGESHA